VLAGEGRVHQCLRYNRDKLTEACRNEEMKLAALEYRDIRLRPKLNKLCSEEKAVYCKVGQCWVAWTDRRADARFA
jgi:Golgi apparatus protein 1